MDAYNNDTIAAVSTPPGEGGIAIIRLSGEKSIFITKLIFSAKVPLSSVESHQALHGWIQENNEPIDEAVVTVYKKPNSYTGEDVVEIGCHGGNFVSRRILELILEKGARPASPGEFTRRAFLNNKMDLSQAEAVADLIHAKTEASRRVAVYQLQGIYSRRIQDLKNKLIELCSRLELELDFCEEDVKFISRDELLTQLVSIRLRIHQFIKSFNRGRICKEGFRAVIVGRPNVGKSSLLNALLERERAIVAETPGTTRDTIEDVLDLEGLLLTITDTAGIRKTRNPVEAEGVQRAEKAIETADLVLLILDGSKALGKEDEKLILRFKESDKTVITVINKADLPQKMDPLELRKTFHVNLIKISALKGGKVESLISAMKENVLSGGMPDRDEMVVTNIRHRDALISAEKMLAQAEESLKMGMSQELLALDLRGALDALEEILGKVTAEDILDKIFSDFCIGK